MSPAKHLNLPFTMQPPMNKIKSYSIHKGALKMDDNDVNVVLPSLPLPSFLAQDILAAQASLTNAVQSLANLQIATARATFEAMPLEQRDRYCQSLEDSGYTTKQIVSITGKSQPTVNRHLNGKNS